MEKRIVIILIFLFVFSSIQAQNLFEGSVLLENENENENGISLASLKKDTELDNKNDQQINAEKDIVHGFQYTWAWDLPNYREDPRGVHFIEPSWVVDNINYFSIGRDTHKQDFKSFFTVVAIRAFAFQWEKGSISFGPFWAYALEGFDGRNEEAIVDINNTPTELALEGLSSLNQTHSVGLSGLLTFLDIGLQANINVGYYYTMSHTDIKEYSGTATQGLDWFDQTYRDYKYDQRSEGFFCYTEVYMAFDRPYLNFFRARCQLLCEATSRRKGSRAALELGHSGVTSPGRVKLPYTLIEPNTFTAMPFGDLQEDRSNTTLLYTSLNTTLFSIPFGIDSKPFFPGQGLVFDLIGSFACSREFQGHSLGLGAGITMMDLIEIDYQYIWEQDNNSYDYWTLLVALLI